MNPTLRFLPLCFALAAAALPAQMEKRDDALFERQRFLQAEPAVGTMAPDLVLIDLDGRPHALSQWRGRIVVVIKAGFT
ncbi:MAG: hypothetical protein JNK15_22730 [Planctomycetes bacterium]|nr:hypothetical protein [Planctomycetota bacterium]